MKTVLCLLGCLIFGGALTGQLSSSDIRQASGKGPYPIYINFQAVRAPVKRTFGELIGGYATQYGAPDRTGLNGFEVNIGTAINEDNFLWIRNLRVKRFGIELGYRYLYTNMKREDDGVRLHLQEEVGSLRFGVRGNLLYPITYQLQIGPTLYNFASAREINPVGPDGPRVRRGTGLFERKSSNNRIVSGLDVRARLMILDPAGTGGGLGFFFETRYLNTFKQRSLDPFYTQFEVPPGRHDLSWDYFSWSIGVVAPLALRIVSF